MARKPKTNPDAPPVGRATVKTDANRDKLCQAIELGATYRLACQYGNISHETFSQWREKYPEFVEAINRAEGKGAISNLAIIRNSAKGWTDETGKQYPPNWQASAWVLERRYPEQYGRRVIDANIKGTLEIKTFEDIVTHDKTTNSNDENATETDDPFA